MMREAVVCQNRTLRCVNTVQKKGATQIAAPQKLN